MEVIISVGPNVYTGAGILVETTITVVEYILPKL